MVLVSLWLVLILFSAQCQSLQLVFVKNDDECIAYPSIFDLNASIYDTIDYTTSLSPTLLPADQISVIQQSIAGCNIRADNRGYYLLDTLSGLTDLANESQCFTVFVGPSLGCDCAFISDWMVKTPSSIPMLLRPYQVNYMCPLVQMAREYVLSNRDQLTELHFEDENSIRYAEVSMTLQVDTITEMFSSILQFQGWQRVMLLHEISADFMPLCGMIDRIIFAFDANSRIGTSADIITNSGIHYNMNFTALLNPVIRQLDSKLFNNKNSFFQRLYY